MGPSTGRMLRCRGCERAEWAATSSAKIQSAQGIDEAKDSRILLVLGVVPAQANASIHHILTSDRLWEPASLADWLDRKEI